MAGGAAPGDACLCLIWRAPIATAAPSAALRIALVAAGATGVLALGAAPALFAVVLRDFVEGSAFMATGIALRPCSSGHGSAAYLMLLAGWSMMFPWPVPVFAAVLAALAEMAWRALDHHVADSADVAIAPARLAVAMRQQS